MTLDKPKTSFSFQGAPGSNSLLFFSFLFSCLLSVTRRRKSTSPVQDGHGVKFLFHTLWAGSQRPHPAVPVRTRWHQRVPGLGSVTERGVTARGVTAEPVGRVLGVAEPLPP